MCLAVGSVSRRCQSLPSSFNRGNRGNRDNRDNRGGNRGNRGRDNRGNRGNKSWSQMNAALTDAKKARKVAKSLGCPLQRGHAKDHAERLTIDHHAAKDAHVRVGRDGVILVSSIAL